MSRTCVGLPSTAFALGPGTLVASFKIIKASQGQECSYSFVTVTFSSLSDALQNSEINTQLPRCASSNPGFVTEWPGNFEWVTTQVFQVLISTSINMISNSIYLIRWM